MRITPYGMKIRLCLFVQPLHVQGQGMENGEKAARQDEQRCQRRLFPFVRGSRASDGLAEDSL